MNNTVPRTPWLIVLALVQACGAEGGDGGLTGGAGGGVEAQGGAGASVGTAQAGVSGSGSVGGGHVTTTGGASAGRGVQSESGGSNAVAGSAGTASTVGGAALVGGAAGGGGHAGTLAGGSAAGGDAGAGGSAGAAAGNPGSAGSAGNPPPCAMNQMSACKGTNPIECHFGGAAGDYEVTIELGGAMPGDMYVEAEAYRRVLGVTKTAAGETERFSFFVNVRQPEGEPIQSVPAGTPGLDVYIRGTTPRLASICYQMKKPSPKIWIAGDSTVCDQTSTDYSGWGQHLPQFFSAPISIANYADSGESSGSVLGSAKLWGAIKGGWSAGDWVLIQLGHNDKDTSAATFRANLSTMVTQAKAASVNPILVTPISRAGTGLQQQHVNSTGANLPQIIRDLGKSENVPVIDLTITTWNWLETVDWKEYFALGTDRTHPNHKGAGVIAGFVRDDVRAQKLPLSPYLR